MFKKYLLPVTLLLVISVPFLYSQNATIQLQDRGLSTYQEIYVSDLDFLNVGVAKDLFSIILSKDSGNMYGEISITLTKEGSILATLTSNVFSFPTSAGRWSFTNIQLSNKSFNFNGEQGGEFIKINTTDRNKAAGKVVDEIEATNKIPFGRYRLEVALSYGPGPSNRNNSSLGNDIEINITNPYNLSQISPGYSLNSGFVYQLYTLNPVFQWNGNSGDYQVAVFKKQNDFSTPEDILNSQPVWESNRGGVLFAQYPEGGAVPLEYGAEYVWQVRSFITTSSGENIIQSELWEFAIIDPSASGATEESMAQQEFENLLRQLIGDNAEPIIREIGNFKLSIIRVNGQILSAPELYKYIERYRNQENEISDITLRSSN